MWGMISVLQSNMAKAQTNILWSVSEGVAKVEGIPLYRSQVLAWGGEQITNVWRNKRGY